MPCLWCSLAQSKRDLETFVGMASREPDSGRSKRSRQALDSGQPTIGRQPHELRIRTRSGLGLDQIVIVLHRLDAEIEMRGDLFGRGAAGELAQDLDLAFAQLIQRRARR